MPDPLRPAAVRVPCSTSNLGSGFDTLGLALDRYVTADFTPGGDRLALQYGGTLAELDADPAEDLVASTFVGSLSAAGVEAHGVLRVASEIPLAKGLGSSAAATLAGYDLAAAVRGKETDREGALQAAATREGHGDNAAPCLLGGLVAVASTLDGLRAMRLPLSDKVGFAFAAPGPGLSTRAAREALPAQVDHAVAAAGLGRFAALLRGLAEGNPELIAIGVEDQLHVPHRLPLIPGAYNAMGGGHDAGAWAVTISGAGSGLLAFCDPRDAQAVAEAMSHMFGGEDSGCVGFAVHPDLVGMTRV